ncbi:MAG: 1-deoxy-D-xylulose-5-phosphate reductoisomerase [Clostridia bacterium]|nr:1-deoxy-D-xylulose-5-phosphate reductoisomerase [Clostridia bacterium]
MDTKLLTILGSTGSIGTQALEVAKLRGFGIYALTADRSVETMESQIRAFHPRYAAMRNEDAANDLRVRVADTATKVLSGEEGVCFIASQPVDYLLNSIVGMAGLRPTLCAIEAGSTIALANKETLVAGGQLVMSRAGEKGVTILPVDSEHSAIFQSLRGMTDHTQIRRILLTASGGPFFGRTREELRDVTVADALHHPNWSMGAKITVDSATMMNKGLELIEAVWLFDVSPEQIDILVHRQSVVHSAVEFCDNSVIAQLGVPDMRIPIQYALTYPDRFPSPVRQLRLEEYGTLTFEKPDYETFACINLCKAAILQGGLRPAAVNSANEEANAMFRRGEIGFLEIAQLVEAAAAAAPAQSAYTLQDVLDVDALMRERVQSLKK